MNRLLALLLLAALPMEGDAEEGLGRLFFTSEQRSRMDAGRWQQGDSTAAQPEVVPRSGSITLNGMIWRSDGKAILWINDKPQGDDSGVHALAGRRSVRLKVGQRLDVATGTVAEVWHREPEPLPLSGTGGSAIPSAEPASASRAPQGRSRAVRPTRGGGRKAAAAPKGTGK